MLEGAIEPSEMHLGDFDDQVSVNDQVNVTGQVNLTV